MTRADKFLLAGLLLSALFAAAVLYTPLSLFRARVEPVRAVIIAGGQVVRRISLPADRRSTFAVQGRLGPATVEVEGARIRILSAPCSGRICVRQGWIEHPGQSIVCIPGEMLIRMEGAAPLDAVTR